MPSKQELSELEVFRKSILVDENGYQRDLWPTPPTREECVAAKFPTTFQSLALLASVWPALTIEQKEFLGFKRGPRAVEIERLALAAVQARQSENAA